MRKLFACLTFLLVSGAVPVDARVHFPIAFHTGLMTIHSGQQLHLHALNTRGARGAMCTAEIAVFDRAGTQVAMDSFDLAEGAVGTLMVPVRAATEQLWARGMVSTDPAKCNVVFTGEVFGADGQTDVFLHLLPCFNPQPEPPGMGC